MRIVTWNLDHGRASDVWRKLQASVGADVVLLQETGRPTWSGSSAWECVPGYSEGSAVLSMDGMLRTTPISGYEGWVVGGELVGSCLNEPGRALFVFSVHSPSSFRDSPRGSYVAEVVSILGRIQEKLPDQADLILGGDFNFVSLGARAEDEEIKTTRAEQAALSMFGKLGLVSCWAVAHPGSPLKQTLRWTGAKTPGRSKPYHADGIFVPAPWRGGIACEVLTSSEFEVSDHYPVLARISR